MNKGQSKKTLPSLQSTQLYHKHELVTNSRNPHYYFMVLTSK